MTGITRPSGETEDVTRPLIANARDDGGPAVFGGMSLRDWFAGQAITREVGPGSYEWRAAEAYRIADAMLEARRK